MQSAGETPISSSMKVTPLYQALYGDKIICFPEVRSLAFHGIPDGDEKGNLRPIVWRLLLGVLPEDQRDWSHALLISRNKYMDIQQQVLTAVESCPDTASEQQIQEYDLDRNLLHDIKKDVTRTQAHMHFFALDGQANEWMCNILFVFAKLNPDLAYIQGMNEILAPILYVLGTDPDKEWSQYAEADSFTCFCTIMKAMKILFLKPTPECSKTGIHTQMQRLSRLIHQHDPILAQHLNSLGVSTDYYSLRWYTTLLAREFAMPETVRIWDSLFADVNRFVFLHYVSCALVLSQRNALLDLSFEGCLRQLQSLTVPSVEDLLDHAVHLRAMDRKTDQQQKQRVGYRPITSKVTKVSQATVM